MHIPSLPEHTGGFTITSTPADASDRPRQDPLPPSRRNQKLVASPRPYFELAIQHSPMNPSAAWLWKDEAEIMNENVFVRVGGNFTWSAEKRSLKRAVFVAGGVGIKYKILTVDRTRYMLIMPSPLISMMSHLAQPEQKQSLPQTVKLLYATRLAGETLDQVLFFPQLKQIFQELNSGNNKSNTVDLHLTDGPSPADQKIVAPWMDIYYNRISKQHLLSSIGPTANPQHGVTVYICGPPAMTDEFVEVLKAEENMEENVFYEKWW